MLRYIIVGTFSLLLLSFGVVSSQETPDQADALALLAKIDGKAKSDPENPKRVIGIDI
jgi:hypothetical protein